MEFNPLHLPPPETLFAATLYLATKYAKSGCPRVCHMIMRQLMCILNHPSESVSPALRDTCRRLHAEWSRIAAERVQTQELTSGGIVESIESIH